MQNSVAYNIATQGNTFNMKKILSAIVFFASFLHVQGQCIDSFSTNVVRGTCFSNAQVTISVPASCAGNFLGILTFPDGTQDVQPLAGNPLSFTFSSLRAGTYTATVMDQSTGQMAASPKVLNVGTDYVVMNVTEIKSFAPTCATGKDGKITFKIPTGGVGDFRVSVESTSGQVLLAPRVFQRPTGSNVITVEGGIGTDAIPEGEVVLVIEDLVNGTPQCGETRRIYLVVPPVVKNYKCLTFIRNYLHTYIYSGTASPTDPIRCKYKMTYGIRSVEGVSLTINATPAEVLAYFGQPGSFVVQNITKGTTTDYSNTFNTSYYSTPNVFDEGDEIKITINVGNLQRVEHFIFNNITNRVPSLLSLSNVSSATNACPSVKSLWMAMSVSSFGNNYDDLSTAGQKNLVNLGWTGNYTWASAVSVYKKDETTGSFVGPLPVGTTSGTITLSGNRVGLDNMGEGEYKVVWKHPNGCYPDLERTIVIKAPNPTYSLQAAFNSIIVGRGVYEGTSAIGFTAYGSTFAYPATITIEPIDGNPTKTIVTKLPTEDETYTRTVTFRKQRVLTAATSVSFGDFPPGTYSITMEDQCNAPITRTFTFNPMERITGTYSLQRTCELGSYSYDLGNNYVGTINSVSARLERKNPAVSGGWQSVETKYGRANTFVNLPLGEYRVVFYNFSYTYNTGSSRFSGWTVMPPTFDASLGLADNHYTFASSNIKGYRYFEITPNPVIDPEVTSSACDSSSPPYVSVSVNNPQIITYPLTFDLVNATTNVSVASVTYSSGTTSHIFTNVPQGNYKLITSHQCGSVPKDVTVQASNYFPPMIVPTTISANPCVGNQVTLIFTGIEQLFDIKWFRLDASGNRIGSVLGTNRTYSTLVTETTTFEVEYNLKTTVACSQGDVKKLQATVAVVRDTTAPSVSAMPNLTVNASLGRCVAPVVWAEPVITDQCTYTVTRSHNSGDEFPIGTTSVTYVVTDILGNTTTRTFLVTVNSNAIGMSLSGVYTNESGTVLSQLTPNQSFLYEIRYKNTGSEHIKAAVLTVTLPTNTQVSLQDAPNNQPNVSGASNGSVAPTYTYNSNTKTYSFVIPEATVTQGSVERVIKIPLKLTGGCEAAVAPCGNYVASGLTLEFEGGPTGCSLPKQTKTVTSTTTINTDNCRRQELYCNEEMTFSITTGFDSYQWFKNGVLVGTGAVFTSTGAGVYKVVKTVTCQGVSVSSTETIELVAPTSAIDPIRSQANNIGVYCANNNIWTSHFFLCNTGSKTLHVNYANTDFVWQQSTGNCTVPFEGCPFVEDSCWQDVSTTNNFTINTAGKYRLKIKNDACGTSYYFDVFTNGLSAEIPTNNIGHQSDYSLGYFTIRMATSGVTYDIQLTNTTSGVVTNYTTTSNVYQITGLTEGSYSVKVTSPQIQQCEYNGTVRIEKRVEMKMTAQFLAWTSCNTAKIRFTAEGGQAPYNFAIWSIDGGQLHNTPAEAIQNATIATLPVNQSYIDADIPGITQVGDYIFVAGDQRNGAAVISSPAIQIAPPTPHTFSVDVTHIQCDTTAKEGAIVVNFDTQQNRTVRLFSLSGNSRVLPAIAENGTGVFPNLGVGNYEIEIEVTIGGTICKYTKKPIEIKPAQNPIKAFVGVVADKECDTVNTPKQYKVAVNNVSGGYGSYSYSFDGGASYGSSNIGYMGSSGSVRVRDNKGCEAILTVTITPSAIPEITYTQPIDYRCDNGYGIVTFTMSSTVNYNYKYSINGETEQQVSGSTFIRELAPGTHTVEVSYNPQPGVGTTPNILFVDDFGTGDDACGSSINDLTCRLNQTLFDGEYVITQQVQANANWVSPTPTDPTGGRYLAVMGNGGGEIVYRKLLSGAVPNTTDLHVQLDARSLLINSGNNSNLDVEIRDVSNNLLDRKQVGGGNIPHGGNWETYNLVFDRTKITSTSLLLVIRNNGNSSASVLGNDLALDNIKVWQETLYCGAKVSKPITIEQNRQLSISKVSSTDVTCENSTDGTLTIKVNNPPANKIVEYSVDGQSTWTSVTVTSANTFTVNNLPVTTNGVIYVRNPNQVICTVDFTPYQIGAPIPLKVEVSVLEKVSCLGNATIKVVASGGKGTTYQYRLNTTSYQNSPDFSNLSAGTYTVTVRDGNNCEKSISLVVEPVKALVAIASPVVCYEQNGKGIVTVNVTSGNGNYKFKRVGDANVYSPASGGDSYEFTDLSVGTHTFVVTDGAGCTYTATTQVFAPLRLEVTPGTQYLDCNSTPVQYTLTATGGDPTAIKQFRYSNDGGITYNQIAASISTTNFSTLASGDYTFLVVYYPNGEECKAVATRKVVYDPPRFIVSSLTTEEAFCGEANGAIIIKASDYHSSTATNTIEVFQNDGNGNITGGALNASALAAGDYIVRITDSRSCVVTKTVTVPGLEALTATMTMESPISCTGSGTQLAKYRIHLLNNGGKAPFNVRVENTANGYIRTKILMTHADTQLFENLDFGNYRAIITDANNCRTIVPFEVLANANFIITTSVVAPTACATTGSIRVTGVNSEFDVIAAPNGYWFTTYEPGLTPPVLTPADVLAGVVTHNGHTWYKGTLTSSGGHSGAYYEFTNLQPGVEYTFTMYNSGNGCSYTQKATIPVPTFSTLTATALVPTATTCNSIDDGKVNFSVENWQVTTNTIKYQVYRYLGNTTVTSTGASGILPTSGTLPAPGTGISTSGVATGLAAGQYYILFTEIDGSGNGTCVNASAMFEIEKTATELEIDPRTIKTATCNEAGIVNLAISGGMAGYSYGFNQTGTPVYPFTTSSSVNINVGQGVWYVYVKDLNGCEKTATVTVTKDPEPVIGSVEVLYCSADSSSGTVPVRVTLAQKGQGTHFYRLNTSSEEPVNWEVSNNSFLIYVAPNTSPYTLTVRDANLCQTATSTTVNDFIDFNVSVTSVATCRTSVPTVSVGVSTPTGGATPFFYTLEVVENKGTTEENVIETVAQNQPFSASITLTSPTYGDYKMSIYNANTSACPVSKYFTVLAPIVPDVATATVVVTPEKCDPNTGAIDIAMPRTEILGYTFEITQTRELASGSSSAVSIAPTSSTLYSAKFDALQGSVMGTEYTIRVTSNGSGCYAERTAIVYASEPLTLQSGVVTATQYGCNSSGGFTLATVTIDSTRITGGVAPYKITIYDAVSGAALSNGNSYSLPDMIGGSFYAEISDTNGCTVSTTTVTIAPTFSLDTVSVTTTQSITCSVKENITVNVSVSPAYTGTAITYNLLNLTTKVVIQQATVTATSHIFNGLDIGNYEITVRNELTGCEVKTTHKVSNPNTFEVVATAAVRPICYGDNGSITLEFMDKELANGDQATSGFSYVITALGSSSALVSNTVLGTTTTINGLASGVYDVVATALSNNCSTASVRFVIPQSPSQIRVTAKETRGVTCDDNKGEIWVTVAGGEPTFTVTLTGVTSGNVLSMTDVQRNALFTGLRADTYLITLVDSTGCSVFTGTTSLTLSLPATVSATATSTQITCIGSTDGTITIENVSGGSGVGTYHYVLYSGATVIREPQTSNVFTNLPVGVYEPRVIDAWNCGVSLPTISIVEPLPIDAAISSAGSKFYTCYGQEDAEISVSLLGGGTAPYNVVILNTATNMQVSRQYGVNSGSVLFNNIPPGNYLVNVNDVNGCVMTKTVSFTVEEFPDISIYEVEQKGYCEANTYQDYLEVRFATALDFSKVEYALNGSSTKGTFSNTTGHIARIYDFDRTIASQYITVYYTETVGGVTGVCQTISDTFEVENILPLTLKTVTNTSLNTIEVLAEGGNPQYTYYFNDRNNGDNPVYVIRKTDPERINESGKVIKIIDVKVQDAKGCTTTITVESFFYDIDIPNIFTPDGDGNNDKWKPKYTENFPKLKFFIYDRYGRNIATLKQGEEWDGNYNGTPLPTGDYWYLLDLNDQDDQRKFYGNFTLYR